MTSAQLESNSIETAHPRLLDPAAVHHANAGQIGSKAAGLVALADADLPVPAFICVSTAVFDDLVNSMPLELQMTLQHPPSDHKELLAISEQARAHIRQTGLSSSDLTALTELLSSAFTSDALFAVRSSSVGEDSPRHSFAGQFDSFLCTPENRVSKRVLDCFASAFSANVLTYRRVRCIEMDATRMGVVIQLMVDSQASGVAFTADPNSGRTDRVLISAGLGLGEGIVDGRVDTDTYVLDSRCTIIERTIRHKYKSVVRDPNQPGETLLTNVANVEAKTPSLKDGLVSKVAKVARSLALARKTPQDVEWAIDVDGQLYVLQARPITTISGRSLVFDNSNIVESYPGLTSPLTFSLMRRAYEVNFLGLVRAFGAPSTMVERNRDIYSNLVGLLEGRMYYNLSNWYRMFLQLPGIERALPAFENAMGFEPRPIESQRLSLRERLRWIPLQVFFIVRLIFAWARISARVRSFRVVFDEIKQQVNERGVEDIEAHELVDQLEQYSERLFDKMTVAPISDFFTQQIYGLLGHLIDAWDLGDSVALRNELLCGETGMESVEPVRSLVRIAERIRADTATRTLFDSTTTDAEVWSIVEQEPAFAWLQRDLAAHLTRYGDRTLNELKLETATLMDDPSAVIVMLRNYVRGGQDVESMEAREQLIRRTAERSVRSKLRWRPLRRTLFAWALRQCRSGLNTRENIRLTRGQMAGVFRSICRETGQRFVQEGLLERRDDVFFLTVQEVADTVRGASVTRDLNKLTSLRRGEYEGAKQRSAPSRIETHGIVHSLSFDELRPPRRDRAHQSAALQGTGCSPGHVQARAMVIENPVAGMTIDGEILVASTTDPGWVFLMVAAGGLVSEKGNVLSHTAIIGRELGIPTVVGVADAMRAVPDGAMIELNGRAGTVTILPEAQGV